LMLGKIRSGFHPLAILFLSAGTSTAASISEIASRPFAERAVDFFSLSDPVAYWALAGSMLLGACCGMLGAFLVVRRLAMMGDALAHAVLPGVALGFLWNMSRDPLAIFVGAVGAGLLGAGTVRLLRSTTRHGEDAALGFVLASFFGAGVCLMTMIQNLPGASKAGLDSFLFGQAAAMGPEDVVLLAAVAFVSAVAVSLFFKELLVTGFDEDFARSAGMPTGFFQYGLMLLLSFTIVSSLQAAGVVLVSAMLVIPAAAAYLLADRLVFIVWIAAGLGAAAGAVGAFFSYAGRDVPTGPFMVLVASTFFFGVLLFAPRHGILARLWKRRALAARVARENTLKAVYHVIEDGGFAIKSVALADVAKRRGEEGGAMARELEALRRADLAVRDGDRVELTPEGWRRACEIVRNHRLWELYLTHAASLAPDHVHEDAELIEHILGEETVRRLEQRLGHARLDPHGKPIPGLRDMIPGGLNRLGKTTP
jgi:ABC-type Mn2+/Zn2+ transport system permease subunit/Mn-dependent DtxR family transcriptional regulator